MSLPWRRSQSHAQLDFVVCRHTCRLEAHCPGAVLRRTSGKDTCVLLSLAGIQRYEPYRRTDALA